MERSPVVAKKRRKRRELLPGAVLADRWSISKMLDCDWINREVWLAYDNKEEIEVLVETEEIDVKKKSSPLLMELAALRKITSIQVPFVVACGRKEPLFKYLVMECPGPTLGHITRNIEPNPSLQFITKVAIQCISALRAVHEAGYIHRDVKPRNFAFGKHVKVASTLFIINFGSCRLHMINGKPKPQRLQVPVRGNARFASLASHKGRDVGRVDDLVSLVYIVAEMSSTSTELPWADLTDRDEILLMKEATTWDSLLAQLPKQFTLMAELLQGADYATDPDYDAMTQLCTDVLTTNLNVDPDPKQLDVPGFDRYCGMHVDIDTD